MPDTAVYAPGTPIWVDIAAADVESTKRFYKSVFGWDAKAAADDDSAGGYGMFTADGKLVAGYGPQQNPGQPVAWSTYILVDDAAATTAAAKAAGATVLVDAMEVMDAGSMAVFADPTGAVISVWQAGRHTGAELFNSPGALTWNELATRDPGKAAEFYTTVFGWEAPGDPATAEYTEWKNDGKVVGGMMPMGDRIPADVPPHWLAYFAVASADDTVAAVEAAGGKVMMPAMDIPQGRFAVVTDPEGAAFAVIQMKAS